MADCLSKFIVDYYRKFGVEIVRNPHREDYIVRNANQYAVKVWNIEIDPGAVKRIEIDQMVEPPLMYEKVIK